MQTARVVDVALDPRNGGAEAVWTYRAGSGYVVGEAVIVPLGTRSAFGFVVAIYDATEAELGFPFSALKDPLGRVDRLSLPRQLIALAQEVADDTLCPLPVALSVATPPGVRERLVTAWKPALGQTANSLPPVQREVLSVLHDTGELLETNTKKIPVAQARALRALLKLGLVERRLMVQPVQEKSSSEEMLRLTSNESKILTFLQKEGKRKPAQALTLMRLQSAEQGSFRLAEIKALAGVTEVTLKALLNAGLLERVGESGDLLRPAPIPNEAQQLAIQAVVDSVQAREPRSFLLYGVTGSGKTEVYLRAASEALRAGRQVLYVVPEIALAAQSIARLRERFGQAVAVLHSDLANLERLRNWMLIRNGEASVVLGARSALFAPLDNVGLIVVDEEHEGAYKQESAPRYHTKRVATALAKLHHCPVVFGSATPSVESFYQAESNVEGEANGLTLLTLPERAAGAQLPTVYINDLTEGYRVGKPSILCEDLHRRVAETLERGEQVILLLNRRAYAPFLICRDCGHQLQCPRCSVSLSFHRRDRRLRCHHCGHHSAPPDTCPSCSGQRVSPFGVGTEKVEESVAVEFPQTRVARLDRDVARKKGAMEETLALFRSGEIGILVGTQLVAKGLDFPNVTLVGVIAADISLNIPDFRASERTFQLLSQVAGRAGRGSAPGNVVIQTFNPRHPSVVAAQAHDYLSMYEHLRQEREDAIYPPFSRLVNVLFSGENAQAVQRASQEAAQRLEAEGFGGDNPGFELLGPTDCAVERVQNRWRRHLLLKMPPQASANRVRVALLGFEPKGVQVVIDVDPHTLM